MVNVAQTDHVVMSGDWEDEQSQLRKMVKTLFKSNLGFDRLGFCGVDDLNLVVGEQHLLS